MTEFFSCMTCCGEDPHCGVCAGIGGESVHHNIDADDTYVLCCDRYCDGCGAPSCECSCWVLCPACEDEGACKECDDGYVRRDGGKK